MNVPQQVEILLVEDNANDVELKLRGHIVKPVDFEAFARAVSELGLYWVLLNEPPR